MKHVFWELSRGLQSDHQLGTRMFSARLCRTGSDTEGTQLLSAPFLRLRESDEVLTSAFRSV